MRCCRVFVDISARSSEPSGHRRAARVSWRNRRPRRANRNSDGARDPHAVPRAYARHTYERAIRRHIILATAYPTHTAHAHGMHQSSYRQLHILYPYRGNSHIAHCWRIPACNRDRMATPCTRRIVIIGSPSRQSHQHQSTHRNIIRARARARASSRSVSFVAPAADTPASTAARAQPAAQPAAAGACRARARARLQPVVPSHRAYRPGHHHHHHLVVIAPSSRARARTRARVPCICAIRN